MRAPGSAARRPAPGAPERCAQQTNDPASLTKSSGYEPDTNAPYGDSHERTMRFAVGMRSRVTPVRALAAATLVLTGLVLAGLVLGGCGSSDPHHHLSLRRNPSSLLSAVPPEALGHADVYAADGANDLTRRLSGRIRPWCMCPTA